MKPERLIHINRMHRLRKNLNTKSVEQNKFLVKTLSGF